MFYCIFKTTHRMSRSAAALSFSTLDPLPYIDFPHSSIHTTRSQWILLLAFSVHICSQGCKFTISSCQLIFILGRETIRTEKCEYL